MNDFAKPQIRRLFSLKPQSIKARFCLLVCLGFVSSAGFGQKKISYEVAEETYYEISADASLTQVSTQDLITMKPSKESYKITRELKGNKIEETKEYFQYDKTESWLPDIKKIVTNNDGTKIYNGEGKLIFQREHPEEVRQALNEKALKKNSLFDFVELPGINEIKNEPELKNAIIKELSKEKTLIKRARKTLIDGYYLDEGDSEEIELDYAGMTIKTKVRNAKNHEKESEEIYLRRLPNEDRKALKEFERQKIENFNYSDIYKVKYTLYKNYEIDDKEVFNEKNARSSVAEIQAEEVTEVAFKVFPNPGDTEVTVYYSRNLTATNLEILNQQGSKSPVTIISQQNGEIKLDISKLIPGIYIINLQHSLGILTQKIIKN